MSRFGKISLAALVALPLAAGGCKPQRGTANPEDYFPLIQVALGGGETAALIGRNEAIKAKHFGGCVAAESLAVAFDAATQTLGGRLEDKVVFPALEIDASDCIPLRGGESASLGVSVVGPTVVAGYAAPAESVGEDEAAEAEGDGTEADEAATPEEGAESDGEEETAETGDGDAEADEASPAVAGNEDAAVLVETIAGVTLAAVIHYATKLKAADCKKGTAALGAAHYVGGMIKPISDEIADPDGKISVPAVAVDLTECD